MEAKKLYQYRGFWIVWFCGAKSYGIEGSFLYLTSAAVAERVIDTYIEKKYNGR